jgi:small subunit ribosomal protein S8
MSDPIADFLTRLRNAQMAKLPSIKCPSSKTKQSLSKVLQEEGYIDNYSVDPNDGKPLLTVELKYFRGKGVIEEIHRVSRPGLREYQGVSELPKVRAGLGVAIVSTNKGLMSDKKARDAGIGGEVLCTVF